MTVGFDPVGLAEFLARVVFSDVLNCFHIFSQRSFVQEGSPASGSISFRESATAQALLWTHSVECWVLVIFVGPFSLLTSSHPSPAQLPKAYETLEHHQAQACTRDTSDSWIMLDLKDIVFLMGKRQVQRFASQGL